MVVSDAVKSDVAKITVSPNDRQARLMIGLVAFAALVLGAVLGRNEDLYQYFALAGAIVTVYLFLTRQDDLIGVMVVIAAIFIDTYQLVTLPVYLQAAATIIAGLAVLVCYVQRSPAHPWTRTPYLWIWVLVLLLAALEIPFSESVSNAFRYYITVLVSMPLAYMLGMQIGCGTARLRRLLVLLAVVASLISAHAIIQTQFGIDLFLSPQAAAVLGHTAHYMLGTTGKTRAGSFLINPDKLGAYLGVMLPVLIGLVVVLKSLWARFAALMGAGLVAVALLHTYSTASWIATAVGAIAVFLFVTHGWVRLYLPIIVLVLAVALGTLFPASVQALQAHATNPRGLSQRIGAWETGLGVIAHNPLTGIGLGYANYFHRADPFLSPLQVAAVEDPQNSFLELAAMGGVGLALLYILALGLCFLRASGNYLRARGDTRVLIGAVLASAIVLTVNSLGTPGWTFPAIGILGWLMLGAVSSPALLPPPAGTSAPAELAGPLAQTTPAMEATFTTGAGSSEGASA